MAHNGAEHLRRRIEHLQEQRLMGVFTAHDDAELSDLYAIERAWRSPAPSRRAPDGIHSEQAHDLHPAGHFRRPTPPPRDGASAESRCQLCGAPERESRLMRLHIASPTTPREQLVCDGCMRAGEATHDARSPFRRRRNDGAVG